MMFLETIQPKKEIKQGNKWGLILNLMLLCDATQHHLDPVYLSKRAMK